MSFNRELAVCTDHGETGREGDPPLAGLPTLRTPSSSESDAWEGKEPASGLDSQAWDRLQVLVRSFRQAIQRGEKPAIEVYAPEGIPDRKAVLVELMHEELEVRAKAGEPLSLVSYLERFPEVTADPAAFRELMATEFECRRHLATETQSEHHACVDAGSTARPPIRIARYELGRVIGQGAFGVVYRAWDTVLNRPVALKQLRAGETHAPEALERFAREARSTAALRHPHIVPVYDAGQFGGQSYLVSALVEGQNLAEKLAAGRPRFRLSAEWVASLAEALELAHRSGVIHRDIKPANVLIDQEDRAYLTDFGLAKSDAGQATLTKKSQIIGTPAYMAPEQAAGNERVDERTDVYCLGVILYELLTGVRPFHGSEQMLLARIRDEDPRPPRRLDQAIPRDLETVCLKAMAKRPGHRYPDAASFAADLRRYLRGEPVRARRVAPLVALWWRCRRKPVLTGLAAALLLSMAAAFAGITWQWRRTEHQRVQALHALISAHDTIQYLVSFHTTARDKSDDHRHQARRALDSLLARLVDQARAYPELRVSLVSATQGTLNLLDHVLPREDALCAHEKARTVLENLARDDPKDLLVRDCLARCLGIEAGVLLQLGRLEEGEARLLRSLAEWRAYSAIAKGRSQANRSSDHESARGAWINTSLAFSALEARLGRTPEAIASLHEALPVAEELLQDQPRSVGARRRLIVVCSTLASLEEDEDRAQAISHSRRVSELLEQICAASPASISDRDSLADCFCRLGTLEDRIDRRADAIGHLDRAAAVMEDLLLAETPSLLRDQQRLGDCLYQLATLEDRVDRMADAIVHFGRAAGLFENLLRVQPRDTDLRCNLSTCYHIIGRLQVDTGHAGESLEPYRKAVTLRESLCRSEPHISRWHEDCAGTWHRLGEALRILGQPAKAVEASEQSIIHVHEVCAREPLQPKHRALLDARLREVFWSLLALGQRAKAVDHALERKALRPDSPSVNLSVAAQIAAAALLPYSHESVASALLSRERRHHLVLALGAFRDAPTVFGRETQLAMGTGG